MSQPLPEELAEFRRKQQEEYGQYVAVTAIYAGTALAYNEGDPVPVSNVKAHRYEEMGLVRKVERDAAPAPAASAVAAGESAETTTTQRAGAAKGGK